MTFLTFISKSEYDSHVKYKRRNCFLCYLNYIYCEQLPELALSLKNTTRTAHNM